jgi:outer membrane murein-binding lipoprotein Lpp
LETTTNISHSNVNDTLSSRVTTLEKENMQLKKEIQRLQNIFEAHQQNPAQAQEKLQKAQLLEEAASIDLELTELIIQNEVSLELIRNVSL